MKKLIFLISLMSIICVNSYANADFMKQSETGEAEDDEERVLTDSFTIGDYRFDNYNNSGEVEVTCVNKNITLADLRNNATVSHNAATYSVTEVAVDAFKDCKKLVAVYMSDKLKHINAGAFKGCDNLKRIVFDKYIPPTFITGSAEDTFDENHFSDVTIEVLRKKVQFQNNPQWNKFNMIVERLLNGEQIQSTAIIDSEYVSLNCRIFSSDDLLVQTGYWTPGSQIWWEMAVPNNTGKLKLPETIRYLGQEYWVTMLGACSFGGYHITGLNLTKAFVPSTVYCISAECFAKCRSLDEVVIGNGVTVVENHVFYGCNSLKNIYIYATVPPGISTDTEETVFWEVPSDCVLHVPKGSGDAYKNAVGWSRFAVEEFLPGDVNSDGEVDVADFTLVANHILNMQQNGFDVYAADVTGSVTGGPDGEIDIADLTGIANIILYGKSVQNTGE